MMLCNNMKRWLSLCLSAMLLFTVTGITSNAASEKSGIEFFVAPQAEEGGDGSISAPFHSLEQARDAVRELKRQGNYPAEGVTVTLRGGTYGRAESFLLNEEDSGEEGAPVIYRSYPGEEAVLVGGTEIRLADCEKVSTDVIDRSLHGKIYSYNLAEHGVKSYDSLQVTGHSAYYLQIQNLVGATIPVPEIFYNDESMHIARYPNEGYMLLGDIVENGDVIRNWSDDYIGRPEYVAPEDRSKSPTPITFKVDDSHIKKWDNAKHAWVFGYWYYDWSDQTMPVRAIDTKAGTIQTDIPSAYGARKGQRFYIYNLIEELDTPGEWFYDEESGILYVYPLDDNPNSKILMSFSSQNLVDMNRVRHVEFRDITFKGTRACAFNIVSCENVQIRYCMINNISDDGILINEGKNVTVDGCIMTALGGRGVLLNGGDIETLEPGNNSVINCWIYDFARIKRTLYPAVTITGVGNIVKNNLFHDSPHFAIQFSGNDHVIENNEIHSVLKETADAGAIYAGRNCIARGTVIRGNILHDIYSDRGDAQVYGIYLDDQFCGVTIEENVIYNLGGIGLFINGGRDNTAENNIFANISSAAVRISASGRAVNWKTHINFEQTHSLESGLHLTQPYEKYPNLKNILDDDMLNPKYNVIRNNAYFQVPSILILDNSVGGSTLTEKEMREQNTFENGCMITEASEFINAEKGNFNLKEGSTVFAALPEFKTRDYNMAGLITSRLKLNLSRNAIAMAIDKPMTYVNWEKKMIDVENAAVTPVLYQSKTYVPIRFLAEMLDSEVVWDDRAIITYNGKTLELVANSNTAVINGTEIDLGSETVILHERMYVPLRACGDLFEKQVLWDEAGVIIISDESLEAFFDDSMMRDLYNRL